MLKDNSSDDNLSNQISIKCEIRNIEKRVNYFIDDILNFIAEKNKFINRNLSYCSNENFGIVLTTEQKNMLNKEVEKAVKSIPERLTSELNKLYSGISNQPEKKEEEKTTVVTTTAPVKDVPVNYFGY